MKGGTGLGSPRSFGQPSIEVAFDSPQVSLSHFHVVPGFAKAGLPLSPDADPNVPLCVDCDGTLLAGDLLVESAVAYLAGQPWRIFRIALWLLRGRACLKRELADRTAIDVTSLPYHDEVLAMVRAERLRGRNIHLVTAADEYLAQQVANHLGCFDGVIASNGRTNLKGAAKAERLTQLFGEGGFDYAGDHASDLAVWQRARLAVAVAPSLRTKARLATLHPTARIFDGKKAGLASWLGLMRVHQWSKNLLVFIPVLTAHQLTVLPVLLNSLLGFLAFGLAGSGSYILNDLSDLRNDRCHPSKKRRQIAAGEIAPLRALLLAGLLIGAAGLLCAGLPPACGPVLAAYLVLTFSYTIFFKKMLLVDVVLLAALYTVRLLFGHAATGIAHSVWLLAFAIFIFFSLALAKRYTELIAPKIRAGGEVSGRGYRAGDEVPVGGLGAASGVVAVLVLVLYASSPEVQKLYRHPFLLVFLCPLFLYWIGRVWMLAHRAELHHDPVVFALRDPTSYIVGIIACGLMIAASF